MVAVPAATRSGGIPAQGWARVALVLQGLHRTAHAIILVELAEHGNLAIDWGRKDYWWNGAPATFPTDPTVVSVRMMRGEDAELPFMLEAPAPLEPLLWMIGLLAFPTSPAWWLTEDARYRAIRWPNYTVIDHTPEQMRMTAMLGGAPMTAQELAASAGVELGDAQQLVNALGLLGLLREVPITESDAPVIVAEAPTQRKGLFARLRARLAG